MSVQCHRLRSSCTASIHCPGNKGERAHVIWSLLPLYVNQRPLPLDPPTCRQASRTLATDASDAARAAVSVDANGSCWKALWEGLPSELAGSPSVTHLTFWVCL